MKYRLTCLTPLLAGDGSHLSPIDYMVWKDQVSVLDQPRIFRLLAKGARLENYLKQIAFADKLDFASWGGFAQNFADRNIPFEHASSAAHWQRLPSEFLRIPTFVSSHAGPFVPGSALKGALRTALLAGRVSDQSMKDLAGLFSGERVPRNPGLNLEDRFLGSGGASIMKPIGIGDSEAVSRDAMKIFLLRVATLAPKAPGGLELQWKQSPRGSVSGARPQDGTPTFAEMAVPGTVFSGHWRENAYYHQPEIVKALRWKSPLTAAALLKAANDYAGKLLAAHRRYAEVAKLDAVHASIASLETALAEAREKKNACLVCLGWGGGFLSKSAGPSPSSESYRAILKQLVYYAKAVNSGLPFPKTRRVVFFEDRPATLPGWVCLELDSLP